jgi:hypothetical protein
MFTIIGVLLIGIYLIISHIPGTHLAEAVGLAFGIAAALCAVADLLPRYRRP